jgi:hypothetical protein
MFSSDNSLGFRHCAILGYFYIKRKFAIKHMQGQQWGNFHDGQGCRSLITTHGNPRALHNTYPEKQILKQQISNQLERIAYLYYAGYEKVWKD